MNNNFLDILNRNDSNEIKNFLLSDGKKPKPYCPFYFVKGNNTEKGDQKDGRRKTDNGTVDERDQRSNEETEISEQS